MPILSAVVHTSLYVVKLLALWFFLRGHHLPGGGFIAGVVVVAAVALEGLAFGSRAAAAVLPVAAPTLLGGGLTLALLTVIGPLFFGLAPLTSAFGYLHLPLLGKVEWATATLFDLGVFLIVVGAGKAILLRIAIAKYDESVTAPPAPDRAEPGESARSQGEGA